MRYGQYSGVLIVGDSRVPIETFDLGVVEEERLAAADRWPTQPVWPPPILRWTFEGEILMPIALATACGWPCKRPLWRAQARRARARQRR
jgi:hypothetical protein